MADLSIFTDDELREELKRRLIAKRKAMVKEIQYIEFDATIDEVDNVRETYTDGTIKYKSFAFWKYRVVDCTIDIANQYKYNEYYLKQNVFKRSYAPKIGDRVRLRYRKTKKGPECFDLKKAKIIKIL